MLQIGYVYDEIMCNHSDQDNAHPESPNRIKYIYNKLMISGLLGHCIEIRSRKATIDELLLFHDKNYLHIISKIPSYSMYELEHLENRYNSIYLNNNSCESALYSCGSTIELCEKIVTNKIKHGIAIVRPPGHHAESNKAMGFCIFNNVVIASKVLINKHEIKRIAIFDWDAHHGNGTQNAFYDDNKVLYMSIHRYDNGKFYPNSRNGGSHKIGENIGIGYNVNIGWNLTSTSIIGDTEYMYAFDTLIKPMLIEYQPEIIIISAGFDSAHGDPLGNLHVTPICFNHMTFELAKISNVAIVLEGGYNLESISKSALACMDGLFGNTTQLIVNEKVDIQAIKAVYETTLNHQKYWKFMNKN